MDTFVERLKIFRKDGETISVEYWLGNKEVLFTLECCLENGEWFTKSYELGTHQQSYNEMIGSKIEYKDLIIRLNNYVRKEKLEKLLEKRL